MTEFPTSLEEFRRAVEAVHYASNRQLSDVAPPLYEAANRARAAGYGQHINILDRVIEQTPQPAKEVFAETRLHAHDREFHNHGIEALHARRLIVSDVSARAYDLGIECMATHDGAFVPRLLSASEEHAIMTIAADIQAFVQTPDDEDEMGKLTAELGLDTRGFDSTDLTPTVTFLYENRLIRRIAWGSGFCLVTDKRVVLLIARRPHGG